MKKRRKGLVWLIVMCMCLQVLLVHAESEDAAEAGSHEIKTMETKLSAPEEVKQISTGITNITLSWTTVPNATAYIVYRSDDGSTWKRLEATGGVNYTDKTVLPDMKYQYQIQSMRYEDGNWQAGAVSEAVTGSTKLNIVGDLRAESVQSVVNLNWTNVNDGIIYGILRAEAAGGPYTWIAAAGSNKYTDRTVKPDKTYFYQVYAAASVNGTWYTGENSNYAEIYVPDPYALGKVDGIQIANQNDNNFLITWENAANATAYIVYRSENDGESWTRIATTGLTTYQDKSVQYGKDYVYKIQSMRYANGIWNAGPYSENVRKSMLPSVPKDIRTSPGYGSCAVKISWTPTGKASVIGVMRSESADGIYEWRGVANGTSSYVDAGLEEGKTYYYRIYAAVYINGKWYNGEYSDIVTGKVQEAPSEVKTDPAGYHAIEVNWSSVPGVSGYMVWRSADGGSTWQQLGSTWKTTYIDENLTADTWFQYKIQSLNYVDQRWGYAAFSTAVAGKPGVAMVKGVTAVQDYTQYYGIRLNWNAVRGTNITYGILRAPHGSSDYQWIAASTVNSYVDQTGTAGSQYDYKVYAADQTEDGWRNGAQSAAVTGSVRKSDGLPAISNLKITQVNGNGYYVTCNVAAATPIKSVVFPSWTSDGGQDDIVWKYGNYSNGVASCWIYTSEHGNQVGKYETVVYATDSNNKTTGISGSVNVPVYSIGNKTGWYDMEGSRYYLLNGTAVTGWRYIGGLKYYFYPNGALCQNVDSLIGVQSRYVIKVNKQMNCITIYASDGINGFVIPVRSMLCSTGDDTPLGTFYTPQKYRWQGMFNGTYAQFATRLTRGQGFLFHSITYSQKGNNHSLLTEGYNGLGVTRSAGCIRLVCGDAYWIYTRCVLGTEVTVYNSSTPGPFYRPVVAPIPANQNYDPTDPFL